MKLVWCYYRFWFGFDLGDKDELEKIRKWMFNELKLIIDEIWLLNRYIN